MTAQMKRTQHYWMLHVASGCTPYCMLLRVVGSCCAKFETGQTLSYVQTDATTPNNFMSCCLCLHVALRYLKKKPLSINYLLVKFFS